MPGSESAIDAAVASRHFGPNLTVPILLAGPPRALDRQGRALTGALSSARKVTVLSPWSPRLPGTPRLRTAPDRGMIVAFYRLPLSRGLDVARSVEGVVGRVVHAPVTAHISGQPTIGQGLKDASLESAAQAERIALPFLVVVLLLVFGSPLAAAIPVAFGGATLLAGLGTVSIAALAVGIQPLAVSLASMIGLALGVDYSLLIVSRFRDELPAAGTPGGAARAAALSVVTAGRTVASAGVALIAALAVTLALAPGSLLLSAALAAGIVVVLSIASAVLVVPSALALLGHRIDRWQLRPRGRGRPGATVRLSRRLSRRPRLATLAILLPLLALAAPASGFDPNAPGVGQLPAASKVRRDFELVGRTMGRGWTAPLEVIAVAPNGTIARGRRLREVIGLQSQIARDPDVAFVIGPREISAATRPAQDLGGRIDHAVATGRGQLRKLHAGVVRAGDGVRRTRAGIGQAAAGAGRLAAGTGAAAHGGAALAGGANAASVGSRRIGGALGAATEGSRRLAGGAASAAGGAHSLAGRLAQAASAVHDGLPSIEALAAGLARAADGARRLREPAAITETALGRAYAGLQAMSVGKADPHYARVLRAVARARGAASGRDPVTGRPVAAGYDGLDAALEQLQAGLSRAKSGADELGSRSRQLDAGLARLRSGAASLAAGLDRLRAGDAQLLTGLAQLYDGASRLPPGLERLAAGMERLHAGLDQLAGGSDQLGGALASGVRQSAPLEAGMDRIAASVAGAGRRLSRTTARDTRGSPGFFRSGYLTLAALDGTPRRTRRLAATIVSIDRGGRAARLLVIPRSGPDEAATDRLRSRLVATARAYADRAGTSATVGGEGAVLTDFDRATQDRILPTVAALSLITFLVLIPIFRSLLLPLVAVSLTLVTVLATYGALRLLLQGAHPVLGGPGYVSSIAAIGIFAVIFALSIDYVVFLVTRMREAHERGLPTDAAIDHGLVWTGRVVTGAALVMIAVFLSFATTDFSGIREFGVALAIAVAIDATAMRMILLPAIMRMLGPWSWWLPRPLEALLPRPRTTWAPAPDPPGGV